MSNATFDSSSIGSALADAVERVGPAIAHVTAGERSASGIVWSAADHLLATTSRLFHGDRDAPISVQLGNGERRSATLVGVDETTELALVRVATADAPLAEADWSGAARAGLFVAPVARTASGLRTVFGVVTRVGPAWVTARGGSVDAYIDVDGTLPPGFSGGPLIDFAGKVLGVNTRGLVPGGVTLPSATVRRVLALLAAGGTTAPGYLGIALQEIDLPEQLRVEPSAARGLLVTGVGPGSAAEAAHIQVGDTLIAIDGQPLIDHAHLLAALAGKAGQVVKVRLARHGQPLDRDVTPQARAERQAQRAHGHAGHGGWAGWCGHGRR